MSIEVPDGSLKWTAAIDDKEFRAQVDRIEKSIVDLAKLSNEAGKEMEGFARKAAIAIGSYMSLTTGTQFIKDIVRVRGEFQQLEVAFQTMLGSKEKADKLMAEAVDLAAKTPFGLQDVSTAAKQLLAYGFQVETVTQTIRDLGNIAAGVGAPLNDIIYLYGTLRTQGRAYTKDIMQFTGRGIPIISELAKQFGVAEKEVFALVEAGKVGFPEVAKALKNLTVEGGMFFNLMEEQSKTLTGQIANLQDAWDVMLNEIGESQEGVFSAAISAATELVENYQMVLDILKVLAVTYGTYRTAIIATTVAQAVATQAAKGYTVAETLRYQALLLSERATKLLNATMLSNPYVAVATGIAAIVSALVVFNKTADAAKDTQARLNKVQDEAQKNLIKEKVSLESYLAIARNENNTRRQREDAIKKINRLAPEYLGNLTLENLKTKEGIGLINKYVEALTRKARAQAAEKALTEIEEKRLEETTKLRERIDKRLKGVKPEHHDWFKENDPIIKEWMEDFEEVNNSLNKQRDAIQSEIQKDLAAQAAAEGEKQEMIARTVKVIKDEIDELEKRRDAVSKNKEEYKAFTKQIEALEKELEKITGKKAAKAAAKGAKDTASELKQLLKDIEKLELEARTAGMTSQESEIARINARYDAVKKQVEELSIDATKKGGLLQRIETARELELGGEKRQKETEKYKKFLEEQKDLFDKFEQHKLDVGKDRAKQLMRYQTGEFENYVQFLWSELAKLPKDATSNLKREVLAKALTEAEKDQLNKQIDLIAKHQKEVLDKTATFNQQRKKVEEKYQKDLAELRKSSYADEFAEQADNLRKQRDQDLEEINIAAAEASEEFRKLNSIIDDGTKATQKKRLEALKAYLEIVAKMVGKESLYYKQLAQDAKDAQFGFDEDDLRSFERFAGLAADLGKTISEVNGDFRVMGDILQGLTSQAGLLSTAFAKTTEQNKEAKIAAGIQGVTNLIGIVISASNQRRQAEEAYYDSVIAHQLQYNQLLNDQIGLQSELNENVFVKNYEGRLVDGLAQLKDAQKSYAEALQKLMDGQAKLGQRNAINWGNVASGLGSGAAAGAAIGSIVPVIGTAIGAVVGALVGGVVALFGGKKKKDVFGNLLKEYPELIQESASGWEELNVQLAQTLVDQDLVDKKTKLLLQDAIAWTNQINEARQQMEGVISELAGDLGNTLRDSLVNAFKEGTDAAEAFANSVNKVLEDMLSQIIFANVFNNAFDTLQDEMMKSYDLGGDGIWIDDFGRFFEQAGTLTEDFYNALEQARKAAGDFNLDIFKKSQEVGNQANSLSGAIKGITEQQADLLAGQFGAFRLNAAEQLKVATQSLTILNDIRDNTGSSSISAAEIRTILRDIQLNGVKLK
jgi:uncharacterized membrane protein